jgi:hypothetical protein
MNYATSRRIRPTVRFGFCFFYLSLLLLLCVWLFFLGERGKIVSLSGDFADIARAHQFIRLKKTPQKTRLMRSSHIVSMLLMSRLFTTNSFVRTAARPSPVWTFQDLSVSSKVKALPEKTLYVLDGTSMLYFGYHGLIGMRKYYDEEEWAQQPPVNTLTVMANQFAKFVVDVRPNYLAVALDCGKKTFRNTLFPQYKEGRAEVILEFS